MNKVTLYMKLYKLNGWYKREITVTWLFISILIWSSLSQAGQDILNFNVKIIIETKTCDINNNQPISVDFGDGLVINSLDGVSYGKTTIPYTLQCENTVNNPLLRMKFMGSASSNPNYLATSQDNLGVRLMIGDSDWPLNAWVGFNLDSPPTLWGVPIALGGGIDAGEFMASGTLSVEYQ
ncbi:fimbrial protein [Providencia alcalifaciens]|uniref:fimbrial protein n=1 Tax=Providencia alcalifaciens TaxID=126385 RepID=UPI003D96AE56